jgi:predicted ATPase/class 3 adenylate cyclase
MTRPTGTVTLLFTDIEGSTRLWDEHPDEMQVALVRHDAVLREVIESAGGYVFKTVGDAFCAAFADASEAVGAAVAGQRALGAQHWPASAQIRVRMAVHSGMCVERDDDYFGATVNRAARLEAIAHGGQIVVSGATAALVGDRLSNGVTLIDLGRHRLKDLGRAEQVFQVRATALADDFAPLRSLDNPALLHNLPAQASSFIGRNRELSELRGLVDSSRLVTVTGAGGAGKTRLALQVAADLLDGSGDGVWLVDLAPLTSGDLVAPTVATTLGVMEQPGRSMLEALLDALSGQRVLLILDNCEHLVDAVAKVAHSVLASCPRVCLLATSREPLGIDGEHVYRVPPLTLPDAGDEDVDQLGRSEAVWLFMERAAAQKPGFVLDAENAPVVARLCRRLDGMPLALELAAARLRVLSIADLDARLDQRFQVLTGGSRNALPRQQTLRALIDWSYDLLDPSERILLARLSVFVGGWNLDAAEAVGIGDGLEAYQMIDRLGSLVDKSLVQVDDTAARTRFHLLETVRAYAAERLLEQRAADDARRVHRDHYLALAELAAPELLGFRQGEWLDQLESEHDNLRAAMAQCLADPDPVPGLRLGAALRWYWRIRGYATEGAAFIDAMLDRAGDARSDGLRAGALMSAATLLADLGEHSAAEDRCREALSIGRALSDDRLTADALGRLGGTRFRQGAAAEGLAFVDEGLAHARATGRPDSIAALLNAKSLVLASGLEDLEGAERCYMEALPLLREIGDRHHLGVVLCNLAVDALESEDVDTAYEHLADMLSISRELRSLQSMMYCCLVLGLTDIVAEAYDAAAGHFVQALVGARRAGNLPLVASALLGLALVATSGGEARRAAMLHGAADRLLFESEPSFDPLEERYRAADHLRLRETLGDAGFDDGYEAGRALGREDAITLALGPAETRVHAENGDSE